MFYRYLNKIFILILIIFAFLFQIKCEAKIFTKGDKIMDIQDLKNKDSVLEYFLELAKIPSPSMKEDNVANKIIEILNSWNKIYICDKIHIVYIRLE